MPNKDENKPQVTRSIPKHTLYKAGAIGMIVIGLVFFMLYFFSQNMLIAAPGLILIGIGAVALYFLKDRKHDYVVQHVGKKKRAQSANCLNMYLGVISFEEMPNPEGFIQKCRNDNEYYYVNWQPPNTSKIIPFVLPDQQFLDPEILAQRVLELPAHQKIFRRKMDTIQKLRPVFIIGAIIIMWVIIMTTTGGAPGG